MTLQYVTQNVRGKAETIGHTTVADETVAAWLDKKFNLAYVIATEIANKKAHNEAGPYCIYMEILQQQICEVVPNFILQMKYIMYHMSHYPEEMLK